MADVKITELAEDTAPTGDDLIETVNDVAGTPTNKKVQLVNAAKYSASVINLTGALASKPAAGVEGRLYLPTDSNYLLRDTGAAWEYWLDGYKCAVPAVSDFAWVNQGSATAVETQGGIYMTADAVAGNTNLRILKKAAPSTPYTYTALIYPMAWNLSFNAYWMVHRQSSDGKLAVFGLIFDSTNTKVYLQHDTNATTFSANVVSARWEAFQTRVWLRIADNGTNRIYSISTNGQNFYQFASEARTTFLTADEVGIAVDAGGTSTPASAWFASVKTA